MPPRQRQPNLSRSGYPIRDLYTALTDAIAKRSADRACALAAELACTDGQARQLVSHLANTYAERYVSLDGRASERISGSLSTLGSSDARVPGDGRSALLDVVLTMCVGLQDHDALKDILQKGNSREDCCTSAAPTATAMALHLASAIRSCSAAEAISVAWALTSNKDQDDSVSIRVAWDVVTECSDSDSSAAAYVRSAASIFSTMSPPRTTRTRRIPLLLYSVLVAVRAGSFARLAPSLACLREADVNKALGLAKASINGVFNDIMGKDRDAAVEDETDDESSGSEGDFAACCRNAAPSPSSEWDYLWMYTTIPGTSRAASAPRPSTPVAANTPNKVVTVSTTIPRCPRRALKTEGSLTMET